MRTLDLLTLNFFLKCMVWIKLHYTIYIWCRFSYPLQYVFLSNLISYLKICSSIPVNPPPFCGSLPRKSLISRMDWVSCAGDINLPHTHLFLPYDIPPTKKIKYNKILTYILRSIFLEIPHLELPHWWKTLRDTFRLLICLTPLQVNWVMEIN